MRIVHLIARLNDGGPARVLAEWCHESALQGHKVRVVCGRCAPDEPDIGPQLIARGIRVDYLGALGRKPALGKDLKALRAITRHLRGLQPDILHTHTAKAGLLGRLCARYLRLPCLHSYHGHVLSGYWAKPIHAMVRFCEQIVARWEHSHSLTPGLVQELSILHRVGRPRRWHCLPIPVAPLTASPLSRQEIAAKYQLSAWNDASPCIGFLGRLVAVKDPQLFIDAVGALAQIKPQSAWQILIAGDGKLRPQVEQSLQQLPPSCKAWSVGFIPANEALAMMDVMVLTSHNEGTPLTIIEAASLAVPVVATKVGGIKDLKDDAFLQRCERDARLLAQAINAQLGRAPQQIQEQAKAFYRGYCPTTLVPAYLDLYQQIIDERRR